MDEFEEYKKIKEYFEGMEDNIDIQNIKATMRSYVLKQFRKAITRVLKS